ncbi:MAG TPA: MotA/TolQ/ExbB proton channel family protein [Verrucomicrobiae bacterium]|nr:MotA/TolQ/ExbB proton channel family protein [Verrucomicrobiae bacterium]
MNAVLATGGLLYAFQQAELQGKVIVLLLMAGSALTWSVVLTKWQQLRRARESGESFLSQFRRDHDPLHLFINNFEMTECPLYNIYRMGAEEVSTQFGNSNNPRKVAGGYKAFGGSGTTTLAAVDSDVGVAERTVVNLNTLRGALGRAIDTEVMKLETHVSILSTAVTGGPFLGLLGSAWGVMSVFAAMGEYGTVRLGAVAPGISAALLATVVGLLVAVPSLFAYNWLAQRIRHSTMEMESFAEEFVNAVEHNYVTN